MSKKIRHFSLLLVQIGFLASIIEQPLLFLFFGEAVKMELYEIREGQNSHSVS